MLHELRKLDVNDLLVGDETFYLLKNNKIIDYSNSQSIIKIGKTTQNLTKRIKQYTFRKNDPNETLHRVCKEHGIQTRNDYRESWDIEGEWVIPRKYSSKKVEDKIKSMLSNSPMRDEIIRFGNSEYFSINDLLIKELVIEINILFDRLK